MKRTSFDIPVDRSYYFILGGCHEINDLQHIQVHVPGTSLYSNFETQTRNVYELSFQRTDKFEYASLTNQPTSNNNHGMKVDKLFAAIENLLQIDRNLTTQHC